MKKPVIAVDVDDVLFDEHHNIRTFVNEAYGLELTPEHYDVEGPYWGYWETVWGVGQEEGQKRFQAYIDSDAKNASLVLPHAVTTINKLKKKFDLVVITSRNDTLVELTHEWLESHFPKTFKSVEFVAVRSGDQKASKAEIAKHVGASYMIDDNVDHCQLATEVGAQALLFGDYGYNRFYKDGNDSITRVQDWLEVESYFDGNRS